MGWTNAGVQSIFNKYGTRVNSMSLNNGKYLFIGYEHGVQLKDITFETHDGMDVMKVHHKERHGNNILEWDSLISTEFIEAIDIMDESCADFRLDLFRLK